MRASTYLMSAAVLLVSAPSASAQPSRDLNGRYLATSNGEWAMTNDRYQDEVSVRSTWTISTTCSRVNDCTGTISSDQGWTADILARSGQWYVKRLVPHWRTCADGTSVDGWQTYRFYAGDPLTGLAQPDSHTYLGEDVTSTPSGACGINKQLVIELPFKLVPV